MSTSANVHSLDAIKRMRGSLIMFIEEAGQALRSTDAEVQMTQNWLHGQLSHWKNQVKHWEEELEGARAELHRKRVSRSIHNAPDDSEQRNNVRHAERMLARAEEMVDIVKSWVPDLGHAAAQYSGLAAPLADRLTGDLETAIGHIDKMLDTLDKYIHLSAPTTAPISTGSTASAMGNSATTTPDPKAAAKPNGEGQADLAKTAAETPAKDTQPAAKAGT